MLLLVAPIARLPYVVAFFAWLAATLGLYAAALYTIVPFLLTIVLACLPLPAVKNAFDGQTAFLLAGLLGLSMFFMSRRPYTFWNLLGNTDLQAAIHNLLSTNAINYRTVARHCRSNCERLVIRRGSCTDVRVQRLAIVFAFFPGRSVGLFPPNQVALNQTVFGLMHEAGAGVMAAWVIHLAVAVLITALACQVWTRPVPHSLKAAVFSIGALTSTPYMLAYDLAALSVPTAFLVADSLAHGFRPGERFVLTACFLALFLCFNFAVGPMFC